MEISMVGYKEQRGYGQITGVYRRGEERALAWDLEKKESLDIPNKCKPLLKMGDFITFTYSTIAGRVVNIERIGKKQLPPHLKPII